MLAQRLHPAAGARRDREDLDLADGASSCVAAWSATTVRARSSRSTLLTATTTRARRRARARSAMKRSPGPTPCSPLSTSSAASDSASSCSTRRCMRSVSASRGRWTPGRSTSTSWRVAVRSRRRGSPAAWSAGLSETIATLWPTSALTSVDLPTFGRPASATKPARVGAPVTTTGSRACSASISPSSVSWSMPVRCSAPWTIASRRSVGARRADHDVAELARAGDHEVVAVDRERQHVGRARPCRGARG